MGKARKPSAFTVVLQALGAAEYICITRLHMVAHFTHTLGCHIMHERHIFVAPSLLFGAFVLVGTCIRLIVPWSFRSPENN